MSETTGWTYIDGAVDPNGWIEEDMDKQLFQQQCTVFGLNFHEERRQRNQRVQNAHADMLLGCLGRRPSTSSERPARAYLFKMVANGEKAFGVEHLMLDRVRAFDQFAQGEKKNRADVVVNRSVDLRMIQLAEQGKEHLNASDGMQRGINGIGRHRSNVAEHLGVSGVNEMRDVRLRSSLENELLLASDGIVVEDDCTHQLAVVHGLVEEQRVSPARPS